MAPSVHLWMAGGPFKWMTPNAHTEERYHSQSLMFWISFNVDLMLD